MSGERQARPGALPERLSELTGAIVVVDTDTSFVYIGKLQAADEHFITLDEVDVHDMRESHSTRDVYVLDALKFGVRANRKRALVRLARTVSVSRLEDVTRY